MRGASKGEGLGNKFLSHIREVDAVAYVLRCFVDDDVTHVENRIDPLADADVVETELMLADLESLEKRVSQIEKKAKTGDKEAKAQFAVMEKPLAAAARRQARAPRRKMTPEEMPAFRALQLLTSKPVVYVCNVEESAAADGNAFSKQVEERAKAEGAAVVIISAKIESEFAGLAAEDRDAFLDEMGLDEPGLNRLIRAGYALLGSRDLLHRRPEGSARLDDHARHEGAAGRRRHPHRLREGLHPRRDDRLRRLRRRQRRSRRQGGRQDAARRQGLRRPGRRRHALPLCELRTNDDER